MRSGFGQGCPLSPIAAAELSHCWKASSDHIGIQIFMHDRTLWVEPHGTVNSLDQAINASARFDEAFSLQLSADKCFLVAKEHDDCTRRLADTHDFKVGSTLDLLGVSFSGLELCSFALPGPS